MKNIQIIQPILTEYRKNLFDSLIKKKIQFINLLFQYQSLWQFNKTNKTK